MAQREGSVYLVSLAVALVLFLGACGALFFVYNDKETLKLQKAQLEEERATLNKNLETANAAMNSLKRLIAGPESDAVGNTAEAHDTFRQNHLSVAEKAIQDALRDLGRAPLVADENGRVFATLIEPYRHIEDLFKRYQAIRDECVSEHKAATESFEAALATKDTTIQDLQTELTRLNQAVADAEKKFEDSENQRQVEQERFTNEIADLRDESDNERIAFNSQLQRKENELQQLRAKLEEVTREVIAQEDFAELLPDGLLVRVAPGLQKGWMDRGRKHKIMPGMPFRVFQTMKGGRKVYKGTVEVARVDEDYSEVRITEEVDSLRNPIADGDQVASPLYDEAKRLVFVFAGTELHSKEMTLEFLKAKLRSYGITISERVDHETSFVVALKGYETSDEYAEARRLRVPVLREADLLEFIGY